MTYVEIDFDSKRDGDPFLHADIQDDGMIFISPLDPEKPVPPVVEPWMLSWA